MPRLPDWAWGGCWSWAALMTLLGVAVGVRLLGVAVGVTLLGVAVRVTLLGVAGQGCPLIFVSASLFADFLPSPRNPKH